MLLSTRCNILYYAKCTPGFEASALPIEPQARVNVVVKEDHIYLKKAADVVRGWRNHTRSGSVCMFFD